MFNTGFGQQNTSAFGAFGQQPQQPQQPATPSLFGQPAMSSPFGTASTTPQQPASAGSSLFGAQPAQPSTTASPFGASSAFGTPAPAVVGQGQGTGAVPFRAREEMVPGRANNRPDRYQTITMMTQYPNTTLTELRYQDYMANRKGPRAQTSTFGQPASQPSVGLFGSQPSSTFGSTTSSFGQPAQSNTSSGLFGSTQPSTGLFGQPQQSTGLFGSKPQTTTNAFGSTGSAFGSNTGTSAFGSTTQPSSTGTGLFGQPQQQSTGLFGQPQQPAASSPFGSTTNNSFGGFGSNNTSAFGSQNNTSTGGLFGQPQQQSSVFGAKPVTNAFGSTNTGGGLFGQQNNTANTGGGLFGQQNNTGSAFGSSAFGAQNNTTNSGGLFGQQNTNNNTGGGLFGGGFGANNNTNTNSGGLFGQQNNAFGNNNANKGGLFGQNNTTTTSAFGQNNNTTGTGLFGAKPATGGGLFGQSQPATNTGGGLFGQQNNNTTGGGLFGQQNNNATAGRGLFGQSQNSLATNNNTSGGLFGNTANKPAGGGLFGNTSTGTSAFGQKPATGGGLFGSTNTNTNTGGGLFGNTNTNTNTGGGLFGNNANNKPAGTGLFGSTNTGTNTLGGTNNTGGGLFGSSLNNNTNNNSGGSGLFGGGSTGLFGNNNNNNTNTNTTNTSTGLFGAKPASGGLFGGGSTLGSGTNTLGGSNTSGFGFGNSNNNTLGSGLGGGLGTANANANGAANNQGLFGRLTQQQQQQAPVASIDSSDAYLSNRLFSSIVARDPTESIDNDRYPVAVPSSKASSKASAGILVAQNLMPRSLPSVLKIGSDDKKEVGKTITARTAAGAVGDTSISGSGSLALVKVGDSKQGGISSPETEASPAAHQRFRKALYSFANISVDPEAFNFTRKQSQFALPMKPFNSGSPGALSEAEDTADFTGEKTDEKSESDIISNSNLSGADSETSPKEGESKTESVNAEGKADAEAHAAKESSSESKKKGDEDHEEDESSEEDESDGGFAGSPPVIVSSPESSSDSDGFEHVPMDTPSDTPDTEIVDRKGYWISPAQYKLTNMTPRELRTLRNFRVGRREHGFVEFMEPVDLSVYTDVREEICGHFVVFEGNEFALYPDVADMPPVGKGLNVKYRVTLYNVFAKDKSRKVILDPLHPVVVRFQKRLEEQPNRKLVNWSAQTGTCTFEIDPSKK